MIDRRQALQLAVAAALAPEVACARHGRGAAGASGMTFDYYIGPSGSDSNAGTLAEPWTIASLSPYSTGDALTNYGKIAGKSVGLLPGTYGVSALMIAAYDSDEGDNAIALDIPGGTSGSPTYIASSNSSGYYSARTATIEANDNGSYGGGNAIRCSMIGQSDNVGYLTIDGLVLTGASIWCFTLGQTAGTNSNPPNVTLQNCEITGNSAQNSTVASGENCALVQVMSAVDFLLQNNYIHDNEGWTDNSHFTAIIHWGLSSTGTHGTQILYNTIVNSGCIYGKEATQWNATIAYNYIDMTDMTPGGSGGLIAPITGFECDSGNGVGSTMLIHHNILVSYAGNADTDPIFLGGTWINLYTNDGQEYWDYPVYIYNNTMVATSDLNGCGILWFEETAGSKLLTYYNNGIYDAGFNAVNQYGFWFTNPDAFALCDYNVYGTHFQSGVWACFSSNGTQGGVDSEAASFSAWQTDIGSLDAHSSASSTNPFTNGGSLALQYLVESGSNWYNAGKTGGTSGGTTCNIGAWDGIATQIGCNFS